MILSTTYEKTFEFGLNPQWIGTLKTLLSCISFIMESPIFLLVRIQLNHVQFCIFNVLNNYFRVSSFGPIVNEHARELSVKIKWENELSSTIENSHLPKNCGFEGTNLLSTTELSSTPFLKIGRPIVNKQRKSSIFAAFSLQYTKSLKNFLQENIQQQ